MKKFLTISSLLLNLVLTSCKQLKFSEKETAALQEVSSLYGGTCTSTINMTASTKYGNTKSFEIEIDNSAFLNENTKWTEMFAANTAYVFYTFVKDEKPDYSTVKSSIIYQNGGKVSFAYSLDTLEIVYNKMAFVRQFVDILKNQDYKKINEMLKPRIFLTEEDKGKYLNELKAADSVFGEITEFTPMGFRFNYPENGNNFLHISGNLKRTRRDTQFSIDINPAIDKNELYLYGYDF